MYTPQQWIDPRDFDWTDARNGLRPGWKRSQNPFLNAATDDPYNLALRLGNGLEPRIYLGPEPSNQQIMAGTTLDYDVPCEPNFWLYGICASISNYADVSPGNNTFLVQITDSLTGAQLFSNPIDNHVISGIPLVGATPTKLGSGNGYRGPIMPLSTPHLFESPGYPTIRLINTAQSQTLICRVTLFGAVEYPQ